MLGTADVATMLQTKPAKMRGFASILMVGAGR